MNLHTPVLISHLTAREILDSRGVPTLECTCHLTNGRFTSASVPSGASTGSHEAVELRDGDPNRYWGQGVRLAVSNITDKLSGPISGEDPADQAKIDSILLELDGTPQKNLLGGNTLLAVSLACAKAGALKKRVELFQHFADLVSNDQPLFVPVPMFNVMNGGAHADLAVDFQEYMAIPNPLILTNYPDQLRFGSTLVHHLKQVLHEKKLPTAIGDEGGFSPSLKSNLAPLDLISTAGNKSRHELGRSFFISIDLAANTYFRSHRYHLRDYPQPVSQTEYQRFLHHLISKYPIYSLEDPFGEDDWPAWSLFVAQLSGSVQIIADDLTVTNSKLLKKAIQAKACTGMIIKPNQVGTLTETLDVFQTAKSHQLTTIAAHRSGETGDSLIADLAVGCGADAVKFGAPVRGERVAKYNRLLQIYDALNT